jgi:putative transposase
MASTATPLTVTDGYSRFLLECRGLTTTSCADSKPVFRRLFQEYGLPDRIRTDNGVPFATPSLARLSMLSAWWVKLDVLPELIESGCPQQNGRHERMHKTLKAETTRPPAFGMRGQQRRFDDFREEYNEVRPHEGLNQETPGSLFVPSSRKMPDRIPKLEYPPHYETRYVSANACMRWKSRFVNVGSCCIGEWIGLEEIGDGIWDVYFGRLKLGRLLEEHLRIEDQFGLPMSPDCFVTYQPGRSLPTYSKEVVLHSATAWPAFSPRPPSSGCAQAVAKHRIVFSALVVPCTA